MGGGGQGADYPLDTKNRERQKKFFPPQTPLCAHKRALALTHHRETSLILPPQTVRAGYAPASISKYYAYTMSVIWWKLGYNLFHLLNSWRKKFLVDAQSVSLTCLMVLWWGGATCIVTFISYIIHVQPLLKCSKQGLSLWSKDIL